jgi:superfamily I DNA and/or RNA helicase
LSFVRSNKKLDIGFMGDEERINVCLSRARKGIIIVGDIRMF